MTQEMKWIKAIKKKSSEQAANQLISKYYHEIFGFIYKQTLDRELTKDITQDIFISVLRTIHSFDGRASFRTWLYKIANSRLIDHYRSKYYQQNKKTEPIDEKTIYRSVEFTLDVETKEEARKVLEVLSRFERELQQIIRLKIYGEYTFSEIAASLELPESTVKTKYYSTIRKLKNILKGEWR
ncbi:sigma-70 family RNA polymerase sigma factor [Roseburia sp. 1XD42-34]|nr:sigma-70 family RNA polymerase sigma factor [Roseburia sp. 1XD42-34]RKI76854.1 sigma-70 family RNA polymerase sigma factor [Clostridium sp. 1xD42-85]